MDNLEYLVKDGELSIKLKGHIDSNNAPPIEEKLLPLCDQNPDCKIVIDCESLKYISSAGLRVILKLKKKNSQTVLINVSSDVYEIFDMTGFTQMLDVHKAFKTISVKGCEVIGSGANGKVYRIDNETIVKTFMDANALQDIERERQLARTAFVLGVPTAISYDVVKIEGGGYGSVYELLKATNFASMLVKGEKSIDEIAKMSVELLKTIHSKEVDPATMPSMKDRALDWVAFLKDYLDKDVYEKLFKLVSDIPEDNHMIHGDFHLKNIMFQDGEALLIDMDTICHGNPVFEFSFIFNAYLGFSDTDHNVVKEFMGITYEQAGEYWKKLLQYYFEGKDEDYLEIIREKAMLMGFVRLLRREIRRDGLNNDAGRAVIENAKRHISELVPKLDSLVF
ncbi:MAG: anti-sigma factor antagonist [Spirochaetales bacterium]|nr:anti-sigma factor antagonist [Spirochaetales bacterium]